MSNIPKNPIDSVSSFEATSTNSKRLEPSEQFHIDCDAIDVTKKFDVIIASLNSIITYDLLTRAASFLTSQKMFVNKVGDQLVLAKDTDIKYLLQVMNSTPHLSVIGMTKEKERYKELLKVNGQDSHSVENNADVFLGRIDQQAKRLYETKQVLSDDSKISSSEIFFVAAIYNIQAATGWLETLTKCFYEHYNVLIKSIDLFNSEHKATEDFTQLIIINKQTFSHVCGGDISNYYLESLNGYIENVRNYINAIDSSFKVKNPEIINSIQNWVDAINNKITLFKKLYKLHTYGDDNHYELPKNYNYRQFLSLLGLMIQKDNHNVLRKTYNIVRQCQVCKFDAISQGELELKAAVDSVDVRRASACNKLDEMEYVKEKEVIEAMMIEKIKTRFDETQRKLNSIIKQSKEINELKQLPLIKTNNFESILDKYLENICDSSHGSQEYLKYCQYYQLQKKYLRLVKVADTRFSAINKILNLKIMSESDEKVIRQQYYTTQHLISMTRSMHFSANSHRTFVTIDERLENIKTDINCLKSCVNVQREAPARNQDNKNNDSGSIPSTSAKPKPKEAVPLQGILDNIDAAIKKYMTTATNRFWVKWFGINQDRVASIEKLYTLIDDSKDRLQSKMLTSDDALTEFKSAVEQTCKEISSQLNFINRNSLLKTELENIFRGNKNENTATNESSLIIKKLTN